MTTETHEYERLLRRKLDLLLRTGYILLASLADTNRIIRNMKRVAAFLGLQEDYLHIYVTYNMLMVNYSDETHSFSKFQRCDTHGVNMTVITEVSKLSWRAIQEDWDIDQYSDELENISKKRRVYTPLVTAIGAGFACGGFCIQFGCDWMAFLFASIAAFAGFMLRHYLNSAHLNHYMNTAIAAFFSTLIAWGTTFLPGHLTDTPLHPLLACALFIVPGVPMINSVDDMLDNYINIGWTRFLNTLLTVAAMTFGLILIIKFAGVDKSFITTLSLRPDHAYWEYAIAAAISAVGFSMIFNVPLRILPVVAIGGIIAVCTRNYVNLDMGMGLVIGSLAGSVLVSLIAVKAVHWVHVPNHVLSIPSVIPMIPGVLMYRALFGLMGLQGHVGELTSATNFLMNATLAVLGISIGVAIPNIFARRWIAPQRRKFLESIIVQRHQRGEFMRPCQCGDCECGD